MLLQLYIHSDVKPAQAQCYVALRASSVDAALIRVDSWNGRSSRFAAVNIVEGNKVYCVPTVCPEGRTYPARVSFYQPGKFFVVTCSGQREERLMFPGAPTCYGSYSACILLIAPTLELLYRGPNEPTPMTIFSI